MKNKIGVSLLTRTLLCEPKDEYQRELIECFGGAGGLLSYLSSHGVSVVELRDMGSRRDLEGYESAVRLLTEAGLGVSMHIAISDSPAELALSELSGAIEAALSLQPTLTLTVHPCKTQRDTEERYSEWAKVFAQYDSRLVLCLENQRIKKAEDSFKCMNGMAKAVALSDASSRGICWDMGHYAYNMLLGALPLTTLPESDILPLVRHTHIHSLNPSDNNTHCPLTPEPVRTYVDALLECGYDGILNLELAPERYPDISKPSDGLKKSIDTLELILSDA